MIIIGLENTVVGDEKWGRERKKHESPVVLALDKIEC